MEPIKTINFNIEEKIETNKEITEVKYQGQVTSEKSVYSVYYTDKNYLPNNKYIFLNKKTVDITFTDGTGFYGNLRQRIQYEISKLKRND